jgi:fido (protein-threonine AMPylation protein)
MDKNLPLHLQEIIFSNSNPGVSRQISQLVKEKKLRKIAPRVYTPNLQEEPAVLIRRNLFSIIGHLYHGIVLSHRSALEFKPTATGDIFLTDAYKRRTKLPGVTLNIMQGTMNIDGDNALTKGLYVSQQARALLENFQESRKPGPESKTLTIPELEERLEQIARIKGEEGLNELRDKSRQIADRLGMQKEFGKMNRLISALLATGPSKALSSPIAIARTFGQPNDPNRVSLFEKLFVELQQQEFQSLPEQNLSPFTFRNFAFFEAYFSNYIEGTEFEIGEAKKIIETDTPMPSRDEDSHDILGTYKLLSNSTEMAVTPETSDKLLHILQYRHRILLSARLSKNPGEFKDKNNRAGETYFVDQNLVKGTLIKGFDFYRNLNDPFAKAAYMMFLISEVHPFLDGNGRLARVMMNAELVKAGQTRIIIPTVFREDYMGALRQLTRQQSPSAYIRMLSRAQQFSATIIGKNMEEMQYQFEEANAFLEPERGKLKFNPIQSTFNPSEQETPSIERKTGPRR